MEKVVRSQDTSELVKKALLQKDAGMTADEIVVAVHSGKEQRYVSKGAIKTALGKLYHSGEVTKKPVKRKKTLKLMLGGIRNTTVTVVQYSLLQFVREEEKEKKKEGKTTINQ